MLGMGIVAGEAVKESHVSGQAMTTLAGDAVQVEPSRSYLDLFQLPQASTASLAKMEAISFYVDMTSDTAVGGWVEATYKISGAYKRSNTRVSLSTPEGHLITLDATAQGSGTITMAGSGAIYAVSDQTPIERREMAMVQSTEEPAFMSTREAAEKHRRRLRKLGFFDALMTSGSFTMMQAGSF